MLLKVEADRIAGEIQKKRERESKDFDIERLKTMVIIIYSCWSCNL